MPTNRDDNRYQTSIPEISASMSPRSSRSSRRVAKKSVRNLGHELLPVRHVADGPRANRGDQILTFQFDCESDSRPGKDMSPFQPLQQLTLLSTLFLQSFRLNNPRSSPTRPHEKIVL